MKIFIFVILFQTFICRPTFAQCDLVDDFEDGNTQSEIAGLWLAATDQNDGGNSWGTISVIATGYRSKRAMRFDYNLGQKFIDDKSGAFKDPYAFLALMTNEKAFQPSDLSKYKGLRFRVKGKGSYYCLLLGKSSDALEAFLCIFEVKSSRWKAVNLKFEDFKPLASGQAEKMDLRNVILLGIGHRERRKGNFIVDDVKAVLYKKKSAVKKTEVIRFGHLTIRKPEDWAWESSEHYRSELKYEKKATGIVFLGIPMINRNRIPFSDGLTADPGNTKELMECTLHELQKLGFRDIRPLKHYKVRLKHFKTKRFIFESGVSDQIEKDLREMGISGNRVFLQVDFIKYRSTTYELITYMPEKLRREMLPQTARIINALDKHK